MAKKIICIAVFVATIGAFLVDVASGRNFFPVELIGGAAIAVVLGMASTFQGETK